ncbi:helix-turn-helix transcriptional regulator [Parasaccharibacter sp. TMW2.1890]|uniref:helix-turn-helix transcriptional regulator n=1 Tax=Parasaccharibacter sp. TMW2.1890 TaxID=2039289 RepID=UPI0020313C62|nr:MerR family DNA-binding transcriptional regulator [Parasaccharibacter sp. TMW2.1890]
MEHQSGGEGMSKMAPLMTKEEVAEYLGISKSTLERHVRQGKFPDGFRLKNGHLRWTQEAVLTEVEKMRAGTESV